MNAPMTKAEAITACDIEALTRALRAELIIGTNSIPSDLKQLKGWLVWKVTEINPTTGKFNKIPIYPRSRLNRRGEQGSKADMENLGTWKDACAAINADKSVAGVGFALLSPFGIVALDVDHCIESGKLRCEVKQLTNPTYCEISPSGTGVRAFWKGVASDSKNHDGGHELFHSKGFVTVTGNQVKNGHYLCSDTLPSLDAAMQAKLESLSRATSKIGKVSNSERLKEAAKTDHRLQAIINAGLYERDMGGGKHSITCPFESGHSDAGRSPGDADTAYMQPHTNGFEMGHFHCTHASCAHRNDRDFELEIGLASFADGYEVQEILPCGGIETLFNDLVLRDEHVQKMADAEFLIPNMIVRGHVAAYVAPGNGGKTTIFIYLCEKLAAMGMKVLYINVDGSPGDLKRHFAHAEEHGYQVIAPDACDGKSSADVINKFRAIAQGNQSCSEYVFILDTLKKFVDVINKSQAKDLYKLFRTLTVKGATVCLLGHCNKYKDEDGKHIFEGTADLRNDLDELIYLDSCKNEVKNQLEVTTRPDKVRADFSPTSYVIDLNDDRKVSEPGVVFKILSKQERELVDLISEAINAGNHSQKEIIEWVKGKTTVGDKKIRERLIHHSQDENSLFEVKSTGRGKDLHYTIRPLFDAFEEEALV